MRRWIPDGNEDNQKVLSIPNLSSTAQTNNLLRWHQVHTQGSSSFCANGFPDDWLPIEVRGSIHCDHSWSSGGCFEPLDNKYKLQIHAVVVVHTWSLVCVHIKKQTFQKSCTFCFV